MKKLLTWIQLGFVGWTGQCFASDHEIKYSVAPQSQKRAVRWAERHSFKDQTRTIYFFDTLDLSLHENGWIIRVREKKNDQVDLTLKRRPARLGDLRIEWRTHPDLSCETDRLVGRVIASCSLRFKLDQEDWEKVKKGRKPLTEIWPPEARVFLEAHGLNPRLYQRMRTLGPIRARLYDVAIAQGFLAVRVERWEVSSLRDPFVEISFRAPWGQIEAKRSLFLEEMNAQGIEFADEGETKTRAVLEKLVEATR